MLYKDKLVTFQDGLSLYVPDEELVKSTYEHLLIKDPVTPFPFWAQVWPSAKEMVSFLKAETFWIGGKRVLELGAGIGLPSFAMVDHASEMIISDHAPEAVALIEKNTGHLQLKHVKAMCLDWNHFPDHITTDTLLLSDINYAPDEFTSLIALIQKFLEQGTTIILSTPQRITITPFAEALQPFIKRSVLHTTQHMGNDVDIRILILSK